MTIGVVLAHQRAIRLLHLVERRAGTNTQRRVQDLEPGLAGTGLSDPLARRAGLRLRLLVLLAGAATGSRRRLHREALLALGLLARTLFLPSL